VSEEPSLREIPKVELHRHLDGSVRLQTIMDLAERYALDVGAGSLEELRRKATITAPMRDLESVLCCFATLQKVLCSSDALSRVTFENIEDAWRDGVKLLELRFAPAFISRGKDMSNDQIIGGVMEGLIRGMESYPIEVGLIGILPRSMSMERNVEATRDLVRWRKSGCALADRICGFDLADGEDSVDAQSFVPLVEEAREAGMGITVHSGENTSSRYVEKSLELYRPRRIGHGIKAWGDERMVRRLCDLDVMLEICPTSNWLTNSVPSLEAHPLPLLYRAGVPVSINSDDPNLMGIDLVREYEICRSLYGFSEEDFRGINDQALAHSFLPVEARERARARFFPTGAAAPRAL
jgi:adenosine deaminase